MSYCSDGHLAPQQAVAGNGVSVVERGGKEAGSDWASAWVEQQRDLLHKSVAAQEEEAGGEAAEPADRKAGAAGPADACGDLLKQWRGAWSNAQGVRPSGPFSDLLERIPAIGPLREHTETWREVAEAQARCDRLQQDLRAILFRVQHDALDLVQQRVREEPVQQLRDLHKLWVECGEEVYAKVAHGETYCRLQAEFGNAMVRLRAGQQKIIEHWLRQFDLPTRAELNTVHRQLREQKATLREHKELLAGLVGKMQPSKAAAKSTRKKRTAR